MAIKASPTTSRGISLFTDPVSSASKGIGGTTVPGSLFVPPPDVRTSAPRGGPSVADSDMTAAGFGDTMFSQTPAVKMYEQSMAMPTASRSVEAVTGQPIAGPKMYDWNDTMPTSSRSVDAIMSAPQVMGPKMYDWNDTMPTSSRSVEAMKAALDTANPYSAPVAPRAPTSFGGGDFGATSTGGQMLSPGGRMMNQSQTFQLPPQQANPGFSPPKQQYSQGVNPGSFAGQNPVEQARKQYGLPPPAQGMPRPRGNATAPTYAR